MHAYNEYDIVETINKVSKRTHAFIEIHEDIDY